MPIAEFAFDVCLEVYRDAQAQIGRIATVSLDEMGDGLWRPRHKPQLIDFCADFAMAGETALHTKRAHSRLILFQIFHLGGAEYQAARRELGISELSWSVWMGEVKRIVGFELLRRKIFPPSRYFLTRSIDAGDLEILDSPADTPQQTAA